MKIESANTLLANTKLAIEQKNLGPEVVDKPNDPYWAKAAKIFGVDVAEAKRRICCNCEYYDNTPEMIAQMESIPLNQYDIYESPYHRGYCNKLHIICHTTRSCGAWEKKEYAIPDDVGGNYLVGGKQ